MFSQNASIQRNILSFSEFDPELYSSVIHACDLDSDLEALPQGDATLVGSKGFSLSGGQKQRIVSCLRPCFSIRSDKRIKALARAVYSRCSIIVLDDVFSQLDLSTQSIIFERLLSRRGLLRRWKTTVIMATGSAKFLSRADLVVVLSSNGTVEGQGSYQELRAAGNNATKIITSIDARPEEETKSDSAAPKESKSAAKTYIAEKKSKPAEKESDKARQNGDFGIYKYYFACISWTVAAMFLLLQFAYAFLCTFPSKYSNALLYLAQ